MTDRPIIFSAPMIMALLAGRKGMTRRLAWKNDNPTEWLRLWCDFNFRPIPEYPNYAAGRDGIIYRRVSSHEFRPLKATTHDRYPSVSLCRDGDVKTYAVHTLVAIAWLGERPTQKHEVRHLDADTTNAVLTNIDWGTRQDNWSDRSSLGNGVREQHHSAKLSLKQVGEIRSSTAPQRALAAVYGVSQSTIQAARSGANWQALPDAAPRNIELPPATKLWVREQYSGPYDLTGVPPRDWSPGHEIWYWADGNPDDGDWTKPKPGMHMPRWASRLTLTVTGVKVERLQEISKEDARAEGIASDRVIVGCNNHGGSHHEEHATRHFFDGGPDEGFEYAQDAFAALWNSLHGTEAWKANPWVVAVTFSIERKNIDGS